MARPLRIDYEGAWHHITNRGLRKQTIYRNDDDRYDFLELLAVIHERFGIEVNAFCLMDTHYHVLVRTPEGDLSRAMKHLDGVYTQRFNKRHGLDGPLFRGRFASRLIDTDGYLDRAARYVHRNPLEAGMVDELPSYRWSSYPLFLGPDALRPNWLYSTAIAFSAIRTPSELRLMTETGRADARFDPSNFPTVVGSDLFVADSLSKAQVDDQTVCHLRRALRRPEIDDIARLVAEAFDVEVGVLRTCERGRPNQPRLIAAGLCQELGGSSLCEIASYFGFASAQSAGSSAKRFRTRLAEPEFVWEVERLRNLVHSAWPRDPTGQAATR